MASPLRQHGIYRFRGHEWVAVHLASEGSEWRSTALMALPLPWRSTALMALPLWRGSFAMLYLRHDDGLVLDYRDFRPVGTVAELEDTGETEVVDAVGRAPG